MFCAREPDAKGSRMATYDCIHTQLGPKRGSCKAESSSHEADKKGVVE